MSMPSTHAPPAAAPPPAVDDPKEIIRLAIADPVIEELLIAHAVANLRGRSKHDAKDIVHDAYARAMEKAGVYDPAKGPPTPWLQKILSFILLEYFRKNHRFPATGQEWHSHRDLKINPDRDADVADIRFRVDKYLAKLPADQRAMLKLRFYEDLGFDEIARRFKTTPVNARKIVSRGYATIERLAGEDLKGGRS